MITLRSHGFKFSRPEANIVFDVSFLKNPWRDPIVRGSKEKIVQYVAEQEGSMELVYQMAVLLKAYNTNFPDENIQVALCCSAGEYRSPAMVELLSKELEMFRIPYRVEQNENSKI